MRAWYTQASAWCAAHTAVLCGADAVITGDCDMDKASQDLYMLMFVNYTHNAIIPQTHIQQQLYMYNGLFVVKEGKQEA